MRKFPIVDADGHVEEAHINWRERVPEKYRTMAPEPRPATDSQPGVRLLFPRDGALGFTSALAHRARP